ncbi:hypothetical protein BJY04DRAFT_224193 [Aspergillus karnatakaensis]|uniref:uncharacterized protein n=1 Tax=Aspergillus karnatakaensis TaxID=1810916 RepID=UPI003CCE3967
MQSTVTLRDRDSSELARLGKKSVLKRTFGVLSTLGFSCTILATWEAIFGYEPLLRYLRYQLTYFFSPQSSTDTSNQVSNATPAKASKQQLTAPRLVAVLEELSMRLSSCG